MIGAAHVEREYLVDESRAIAQPGQWVEVQGISIGQDEYQADVIRLDQPVPAVVAGELRLVCAPAGGRSSCAWWVIEGTPLWIENGHLARMAGVLEGEEVIVRGVRLGNGVLRVERMVSPAGSAR